MVLHAQRRFLFKCATLNGAQPADAGADGSSGGSSELRREAAVVGLGGWKLLVRRQDKFEWSGDANDAAGELASGGNGCDSYHKASVAKIQLQRRNVCDLWRQLSQRVRRVAVLVVGASELIDRCNQGCAGFGTLATSCSTAPRTGCSLYSLKIAL